MGMPGTSGEYDGGIQTMKRVSVECRNGQYAIVVRIPIDVQFEKGCITIKESDLPFALTSREKQVLTGICNSKCNKEIAKDLNVSDRTVKFHVSSLLTKAQVSSRYELAERYRYNSKSGDVGIQ
jgi:DNA-binding NarL/FixJ family response regulator